MVNIHFSPISLAVPFDATKRNQKSPLKQYCTKTLPYEPRKNIGTRRWTPRALLWSPLERHPERICIGFSLAKITNRATHGSIPTNTRLACPVAEEGGFSVLIRKAPPPGVSFTARRAQAPVFTREAIRGKTGPVPNGAVLFGPFSWAYKKKDEEKTKAEGSGSACAHPERSSMQQLSANRRPVQVH